MKNWKKQKPTPVMEAPPEPPIKVAICIPCQDKVEAKFAVALADLVGMIVAQYCNQGIADLNIFTYNSSYIAWSRTEITKGALAWGATHLLWLDSDMIFPGWTFHHLFKQDKPIIGANYARRRDPHAPVTFKTIVPNGAEDEHKLCYTEKDSTGLEEVDAIGFGVVLVQAQVFNEMKTAPFRVLDDEMSRLRVGEDVYFCQLAKSVGLPIYIDHDLSQHVRHIGTQEFHNGHSVMAREIAKKAIVVMPTAEIVTPKIELVRS